MGARPGVVARLRAGKAGGDNVRPPRCIVVNNAQDVAIPVNSPPGVFNVIMCKSTGIELQSM